MRPMLKRAQRRQARRGSGPWVIGPGVAHGLGPAARPRAACDSGGCAAAPAPVRSTGGAACKFGGRAACRWASLRRATTVASTRAWGRRLVPSRFHGRAAAPPTLPPGALGWAPGDALLELTCPFFLPSQAPEREDFEGAIGFIDVSGFTALSERLVKEHGWKGSEKLNQCGRHLNPQENSSSLKANHPFSIAV